jgi:UbiD family decarboxylase
VSRSEKGNPLDLRAWLREVRDLGELKDVRGADWNLELGAISEVNVRNNLPPALLFDEIAGYPKGFRVLTCSTSSPARLSSILRLGVETTHHALVQKLRGMPMVWQAEAPGYDPVITEFGPTVQNVQEGEKVDLYTFPSPFWHEKDGGRYIGTGCCVVTTDFDTEWVNVGTYRVMIHDRNHVGRFSTTST